MYARGRRDAEAEQAAAWPRITAPVVHGTPAVELEELRWRTQAARLTSAGLRGPAASPGAAPSILSPNWRHLHERSARRA